jgi:hypothetical protein
MPDTASVHFDVALTNISIAYRNATYLAPEIAPDVPVRRQSDRYFIYDPRKDRFRQTFDGRSPGAEASEIDFQLSSDSYYADDHALEAAVPDEERDNADSPLQPEIDRTEFLTDKILLNQEIALAARLRDPAVIPGIDVLANSTAWDADGADPVADIEAARAAILTATQQLPNILVLPFSVYTTVRNSAAVRDRVKYTSASAPGAGGTRGPLRRGARPGRPRRPEHRGRRPGTGHAAGLGEGRPAAAHPAARDPQERRRRAHLHVDPGPRREPRRQRPDLARGTPQGHPRPRPEVLRHQGRRPRRRLPAPQRHRLNHRDPGSDAPRIPPPFPYRGIDTCLPSASS